MSYRTTKAKNLTQTEASPTMAVVRGFYFEQGMLKRLVYVHSTTIAMFTHDLNGGD